LESVKAESASEFIHDIMIGFIQTVIQWSTLRNVRSRYFSLLRRTYILNNRYN
jgi:hypothetical protein